MNFPGAGAPAGGSTPGGYDPNDPNVKKLNALMESCYAKTAMSGVAGFGLGALFGMFMASMSYDTPFHTMSPTDTAPAAAGGAKAGTAVASSAAQAKPGPAGAAASAAPTTTAATSTSGPLASAASSTTPTTAKTSISPIARAAAASASASAAKPAAAPTPAPIATTPAGQAMMPNPGAVLTSSLPLRQQVAIGFRDMGARSYSTAKNFAMVGALFSGIECGIEGLRAKNDMGNGVAAGCITGAILARNGGPQAAAVGCAGFAAFSAAIDAWLRMPKDE